MLPRPPRPTRAATLVPYTTLFRSDYGAFIVPGLIMLSLFTQSIFNASFGIYFPKFTGTIYELLSAPVSTLEIVLAYVGARSEEHTSELQSLMRISYAVFCLKKHKQKITHKTYAHLPYHIKK